MSIEDDKPAIEERTLVIIAKPIAEYNQIKAIFTLSDLSVKPPEELCTTQVLNRI